jgi:dTDP-4-dehydrorhamnose reductase
MKILVIGANSYVGARLYYDLQKDFEVTGTYLHNKLSNKFIHLDITDKEEVAMVINRMKPSFIVHVANNANARWCEANPNEAKRLNETSTKFIVNAANKINAKIIYISSFVVLKPLNVYGKVKQASEEIIKDTKAGWAILRPSLIIGFSPNTINDRPFNRFLKNLDEGTKAEYDTSWKFQPTWIGHISEIIKSIIKNNINKEIIPVAVEGLKTRYEVAKDILSQFNINVFPVNNSDTTSVIQEDLKELDELGLTKYSYDEIINKIINEIKQRSSFVV